jgi:hypothetical protein
MPDAYTYISKPTGSNYSTVNTQGREEYDQANLSYDSDVTYYDSTDENAYTYVPAPTSSTYTFINKPTT